MDFFEVKGEQELKGKVRISGAKNSALIVLMGAVATDKKIIFDRVPDLNDTKTCFDLLNTFGAETSYDPKKKRAIIECSKITPYAPYDLVRTMRASILCLGPLLGRYLEAKVSLPGGCAIGARPINLHLEVFEKMGASIQLDGGYVLAKAKKLHGIEHEFPFISVGATENALLCASCIDDESTFHNCALEPEIDQVIQFVNLMGAKAKRIKNTRTIKIVGTKSPKSVKMEIIPDRIEAGTLLLAGLITNSAITLQDCEPKDIEALTQKIEETGIKLKIGKSSITTTKHNYKFDGVAVTTEEHPGFPTDMQAQFASFLTQAKTSSQITENIFENRFMYVPELQRMNAQINISGKTIEIKPSKLTAATVMASDLRASAALILAALKAKGTTKIRRIYHLDRGYEKLEEKLSHLGAKIKRLQE